MYRPPVVLAYHGICDVDPRDDPLRLFVSPGRFEDQVRRLLARGYEFVSMAEFVSRLGARRAMSGVCALTFDDGTEDHATVLPGLLKRLEVPGTVYVCPGLLGQAYPWAAEGAAQFMSREELLKLSLDPMIEIGAHTNEHTELHEADAATAYHEMASCKKTLEAMLDREISSFAYPRCHYSAACPAAAERAGYASAVTCGARGSWSPHALQRSGVLRPDGRITFALKSRGVFHRTRNLPPARAARWATRRYRHRAERRP